MLQTKGGQTWVADIREEIMWRKLPIYWYTEYWNGENNSWDTLQMRECKLRFLSVLDSVLCTENKGK